MSSSEDRDTWPIQVDPPGCGCTECITGQYVPLDRATEKQVMALICGEMSSGLSRSDLQLRIRIQYTGWAARWAARDGGALSAEIPAGSPEASQAIKFVRDLADN